VALFVLSLPAVTARLYSSDEVQYFSYLRSLWFDRDVSFENEYRYFYDHNIAQSGGYYETFLVRETRAGRRVNYATIGAALLWAPFYAIADLWTRVTGGVADGYSKPYIRAVAYGSAVYGFLAVLLSIRAARLVLGDRSSGDQDVERAAVWGGSVVWLGTPLLFYMYVAPPFSHAVSAFSVALFVTVWLYVRREWTARGTFLLGVCAALLAMVREQDVFLALGPAFDFALALSAPNSQLPTPKVRGWLVAAGAGVAGFFLGYLPQLIAYNGLNGYPGPAEHVARKMYWYTPHALQVLFSPHHGFLFWTPLAVLGIVGLIVMAASRPDRRIALCALIMIASQVYVAGSVESWTVAGAFGQRRFVCLTPLLVIGVAALWRAWPRKRPYQWVLPAALAICVWWNVALMAQFATGMMDRQRLELARNAYNTFVRLPVETPSLVYRYLTDRESFYRPFMRKDSQQ
jgi:hypothetical protein